MKDRQLTDEETPVISEKDIGSHSLKKTGIPVERLKRKRTNTIEKSCRRLEATLLDKMMPVDKVAKAIRRNRVLCKQKSSNWFFPVCWTYWCW